MERIFSLFLFVSASFYLALSFNLEMFSNGIPGSGFLPKIVGALLVIVTLVNVINLFRKDNESDTVFSWEYIQDIAKLLVFIFLYVLTFNILGTLLSTLLFTLFTLIVFNEGKWKQNVLISISIPLVIFIMFDYLLNISLPIGIFEKII